MPDELSARETPSAPSRPASLWLAVTLALVTLGVYGPVTGFQFVNYDDTDFVTANPHVRAGLTAEGFQWAWGSVVTGDWHPLTMLSLMLDCQLFGVKPWWPHLVNLLLHAANTVLLFGLLQRMTGAVWRSAAVAALFALHPLHVESVVWVSERKDVLSTLFWFLTTWAYVRYVEKGRVFYALSLMFYALGLMSKPMLVTVPCTLLLLDFWPLGRMKAGAPWRRLAVEKIPFFALSAALCVVTILVQKQSKGMLSLQNFPLGARLGNALVSYVRYIGMMVWPRHLAALYLLRSVPWPWWEVTLAALLLLAVSGLVLAQGRRRPYLAAGWFWYLGTLVPVIGLAQAGMQAMADRFTYVPLIGLFVMLVWGGWELAGVWHLARFAPAAAAAALAACAVLTVHQEFYWKDSGTFNQRMIDVTPDNYVGHNNLGTFYLDRNRTNEAYAQFVIAVQKNPDYAYARYNLGVFYLKANRINEAISNLTIAIKTKPDYAEAHNDLADIFLDQKRYAEAIQHFRTALRIYPQYIFYFNLANALADEASARHDAGEFAEAVQTYQQVLRLNPESSDAHQNLGLTLQAQGRIPEALAELEQAARLDSNRVDTWTQVGLLCTAQNILPEAERAFRELIRLQPNNANAYVWLGNALARQNKLADAVPSYEAALRLNPADCKTECAVALALLLQGKREQAAEHYRQALRLNRSYAEGQTALRQLESLPDPSQGGTR